MEQVYATGRRKSAVARVFLRPTKTNGGQVLINHRQFAEYFPRDNLRLKVMAPLELTGQVQNYNIFTTVAGGGISGQADAISHGIAMALRKADASFGPILREKGMVTRDARIVERKKVGLHKARRATQFSKR